MNVDDAVRARIAAAARKRAVRQRQREQLDEARQFGLVARHRAKTRRPEENDAA